MHVAWLSLENAKPAQVEERANVPHRERGGSRESEEGKAGAAVVWWCGELNLRDALLPTFSLGESTYMMELCWCWAFPLSVEVEAVCC